MNVKDTVCAVVVTYNRKKLLLECLDALSKQTRPVDAIYIIDNFSSDGTPELLLENGYIDRLPPENLSEPFEMEITSNYKPKVYYVRMHENTGGAGGFHEGVKRGYERGYDWFWLMDDDAEPKEDALEILSLYFKNNDVVGLAGSVLLPDGNIAIYHRGKINLKDIFPLIQIPLNLKEYQKQVIEIDMASFVGLLVKRDAIENIGFPKKEFFIHHDDVEYCIRLRTIGKIFLIPNSVILHKEAAKARMEKSFLGRKSMRIEFNKFWLSYYGMRNLVWLGKQYSENELLFYMQMIKNLIRLLVGVILFDDNKTLRIRLILEAYKNGLTGNFDNLIPKKILYRGEK